MSILTQKDRPFGIKTYVEILEEGFQYIEDRRLGKIKSFNLPWSGLNNAGVGGLEWGSMMTIGARPGAGKTMFVGQIIRESRIFNPLQDFNILEFQFEMGPKQSAARDFVAQTGLDYNQVLSTKKQLDEFYTKSMKRYIEECKLLEKQGVFRIQINNSITCKEMEKAIHTCYNGLGGKPLIVTIDHSWLIKKDRDEKEKLNTLYNTVEMLMQIKNKLPVIVLMITQLNRSIDDPLRKMPGTIGNYPTSSDIFGGDALMQGSDMVFILSRPFKSDITSYGPKEYPSEPDDIFGHIIKSRNGSEDSNMIFLKADFPKQMCLEIPEPQAANPTGSFVRRSARRPAATPPPVGFQPFDPSLIP
jgi:replicative DNA helicase